MRDKLKLYTYPDVPKDGLANDEIVNVKTSYGSFTDAYSWELSELEVWKEAQLLVKYPYHEDAPTTISDAINYIMDMDNEEL